MLSAELADGSVCALRNGESVPLARVPRWATGRFHEIVVRGVNAGRRIAALFGHRLSGDRVGLIAVLADDLNGGLGVCATEVCDRYAALTPSCPQAHWFEREIAEQWGVRPEGHPWLHPIRFHPPCRAGYEVWPELTAGGAQPGVRRFFSVDGEEVHEVAVGPVHAGVIEPGHFRFQCHGERVLHLEISLGYQHRGIERALVGGPDKRAIHWMETLAGDTSVGHATAYAHVIEALAGTSAPARGGALRGLALELERLANHAGDLGALAGDVGYLPAAAHCGRIRGELLNLTALICGSRFGRSLVRPGGCGFDIDEARAELMHDRLARAASDMEVAIALLWDTPSVQARFEHAGPVSAQLAEQLGLVGPAVRACGIARDVRHDFPVGPFRFRQIPVSTAQGGDVAARAQVRWLEMQRSTAYVRDQLGSLPAGPVQAEIGAVAPDRLAVSLVEGWRGEICHVALTDGEGRFGAYKVVDPSFHNWMGLAMAMRDQPISDFPLCNKSFNLSYCGHDL